MAPSYPIRVLTTLSFSTLPAEVLCHHRTVRVTLATWHSRGADPGLSTRGRERVCRQPQQSCFNRINWDLGLRTTWVFDAVRSSR